MARIEAPNAAEIRWISENVARARALAVDVGGSDSLTSLDRAWTTLGAHLRETGGDPNPLINMVGLRYGQELVDQLGLAWVVATDEYGTEMAVHGQPGDILVYPANLVAKRWQSGEGAFLAVLFAAMHAEITRLRAQ